MDSITPLWEWCTFASDLGDVVKRLRALPSERPRQLRNLAVVSRDGRHAISITANNVGLGGTTSVTFRFKERRISPLIPIALFAIAVAYLFGFRTLTTSEAQR